MGLFKKKRRVIDLTEQLKKRQEKIEQIKNEMGSAGNSSSTSTGSASDGFFGAIANTVQTQTGSSEYLDVSNNVEEKRKKLSKRLLDMTNKIEELSNQLYHLQQRVEVLERKLDVNRF